MYHAITRSRRAVAAATFVAALVGAAALLAIAPRAAPAASGPCKPGEFCLYYNADRTGGLYHFAGSDKNLHNDRFEGANSNLVVGDKTASVWNNGYRGTKADVIVYLDVGWGDTGHCVTRGDWGMLPIDWFNKISSYKWVTHRECLRAGVLDLIPVR